MPSFSTGTYDVVVPRTFRMKRVEIDPKTLESPEESRQQQSIPRPEKVLPIKPETPHAEPLSQVLPGQPVLAEEKTWDSADQRTGISLEGLEQKLGKGPGADSQELDFSEIPKTQKGISFPDENPASLLSEEKGGRTGIKGFSSLDDLLKGAGTVSTSTEPILMPTDLLFEYDSFSLKEEAAETLTKLGNLIEKNKTAVFRIEGHTDSFGGDDYNRTLSMRRAEAVKEWLVRSMKIPPERISTVGLGKSRLLVPGDGTVEQQKLNRRVEILITSS
jgi:outer membrane protein OmpA-like peptidoglycan-associated protein